MRLILILSIILSHAVSADYVTIATKDGRSLTGYYDSEEGTLTTTKPKATIRVKLEEIDSVIPVTSPEQDAIKDGGSDLVQQLKGRLSALESDREKASATARRYRTLAKDVRDLTEAKKLEANAESSEGEVRGYQILIDEISAKISQFEGDKRSADPIGEKPRLSAIGQVRQEMEEAQDKSAKVQQEVQDIRTKLNRMIAEANHNFLLNGDLEPIGFSASARPTKEENDRAARISAFNGELETLRGLREKWKRTSTGQRTDNGVFPPNLFTDRFWRSYAELKGKPAPY